MPLDLYARGECFPRLLMKKGMGVDKGTGSKLRSLWSC